jgi:hypothetical protein
MTPRLDLDAIPSELKRLSQWVMWRYDDSRSNGKLGKPPFMPNGRYAKVNNENTWSSFEEATGTLLNPFCSAGVFDGIGFVLSAGDGFIGIDLDNCVNDDGSIEPWALRFVDSLSTYWEYSPSGRGLRGFAKGTLMQIYGDAINRPVTGGGRVEVYQNGHYLTVTGAHLPGTPSTIEPLQDAIEGLLMREFPPFSTGGVKVTDPPPIDVPQQNYRLADHASLSRVDANDDAAVVQRLREKLGAAFCALFDDGNIDAYHGDESKADFALLCDLARECGDNPKLLRRLFEHSALYGRSGRTKKWNARHSADGRTYGEMTIDKAIAEVTSTHARRKSTQRWDIESARAIVERGVPPLEWDVVQLLPHDDGPVLIFAPPGTLKSWLALHLCSCVATGQPFLGYFPVRQRSQAIYINLDAGANALSRRLARMNPPDNLLIINASQFDDNEFENVFRTHPGAFVVIDCFADAGGGVPSRGEDAAQAARGLLRKWRALYERYDANGAIVDHPHRPKEGVSDYYGSIQKEATLRTMWKISRIDERDGCCSVKIECRKQSEAERFKPFVASADFRSPLVRLNFRGFLNETTGQRSEGPSDVARVVSVLEGVPNGLASKGIIELTRLPRDRALLALKDSRFGRRGKAKATRYVIAESDGSSDDLPFDSNITATQSNESDYTQGQTGGQND